MSPLPAEQATAVYTSPLPPPSDNKAFAYQLPEAISDTARLGTLKEVVEKLQADVNAYLTERMEEEKQAELAAGKKGQVREEEEEEENYGEETRISRLLRVAWTWFNRGLGDGLLGREEIQTLNSFPSCFGDDDEDADYETHGLSGLMSDGIVDIWFDGAILAVYVDPASICLPY
ncbi:hypothetical protein EX30DRAFT_370834 [Ascodesmis nigricans]|uniref:EKC/KEOPS complex subunit GON7 n=1 Tax=Ascodesmis nigricans TaxID=341454 RepID=A0A4S2MZC5_9PEZI|nr:hypothetical protein EX30DRAFT_370834 [Ascodesmis nigricans]